MRKLRRKSKSRLKESHYIVPGTNIVLVVVNNRIVTVKPKEWLVA